MGSGDTSRNGSVGARSIVFTVAAIVAFLACGTLATVVNMRRFSVRAVEDFSFTILTETNTTLQSFLVGIHDLAESLAAILSGQSRSEPKKGPCMSRASAPTGPTNSITTLFTSPCHTFHAPEVLKAFVPRLHRIAQEDDLYDVFYNKSCG